MIGVPGWDGVLIDPVRPVPVTPLPGHPGTPVPIVPVTSADIYGGIEFRSRKEARWL